MKHYITNPIGRISQVLLFCLIGITGILSSCKEDDPTVARKPSGIPAVEVVRTTDPADVDSTFTKATLGSTIVIVGKNLAATQYVSFNGYKAAINPSYTTETHLIVRIPDKVPTIATDPNVPHELKVVNAAGETSYQFEVLPPPPVVDEVSNEFAAAGETITIYGKYFYFVKSIIFPGDTTIRYTEFTVNAEATVLTVKVPNGVQVDATNKDFTQDLFVVSESGYSAVNKKIKFRNKTGMILDWDTKTSWDAKLPLNSAWGISEDKSKIVSSYTSIIGSNGEFGLINMDVEPNWGWSNAKLMAIRNNDGSINNGKYFPTTPDENYNPEVSIPNFELRFEMAFATPVDELIVQLTRKNTAGKELKTQVTLSNFVKTFDGKWYTVKINLGDLSADNGATKLVKYKDFTAHADPIFIQVFNPKASGKIKTTAAIDNIRIVNLVK